MALALVVMAASTAAAAALTWQLVNIAKREGIAELFSTVNAGSTFLHLCLLFTWGLLIRDGFEVLLNAAPLNSMAGFGAMFGGVFAMRLAGTKKRTALVEVIKESRG